MNRSPTATGSGVDAARYLVVNADDFGRSPGINRGVMWAHRHGIVTSASLMVLWPSAAEGADRALGHSSLSLGLHLDLGEWVYRAGDWYPIYEVVPCQDATAVAEEVERQIELFERLTGRVPTHLDSHQHVHRSEPLRSIVRRVGRRLGIPVRHLSEEVRYCGSFFGQTAGCEPLPSAVQVPALRRILRALPAGTTELACHPAEAIDWDSAYAGERVAELATLCDPRIATALRTMKIELRSFHDLTLGPPLPA